MNGLFEDFEEKIDEARRSSFFLGTAFGWFILQSQFRLSISHYDFVAPMLLAGFIKVVIDWAREGKPILPEKSPLRPILGRLAFSYEFCVILITCMLLMASVVKFKFGNINKGDFIRDTFEAIGFFIVMLVVTRFCRNLEIFYKTFADGIGGLARKS